MPPAARQEARAFWTGPQLSPYEELSLLSFAATGARVLLYCSDMSLRVPDGVERVPVEELLSANTHAFTYDDSDRCVTPHSDLFRYAAVERFGGWYFDLDIICLRERLPQTKVYLVREADHIVNAAVMKFPAHAPFLAAAREEALRLWPQAGRLTIGPQLITRLAADHALDHLVQPRAKAFEIGTTEIVSMFDPQACEELKARVAGSDFVHLWNEIWRRIRIPKNFGPPEGSFLDGLFRRFDIRFAADARLSIEALRTWQRERHLLAEVASRLDSDSVPEHAFSLLLQQAARPGVSTSWIYRQESRPQRPVAAAPATVRTFWHGGAIGPWQLMALRSFVERGHRVEVFTFDTGTELPQWLSRRDAGEILPQDRVVRYLAQDERFAIHASLFRCALLHKLGGWWIDPDVVLLRADLPAEDMFVGGPTEFGVVSTAALKVPAGHPLMAEALRRIAPFERSIPDWERTGAPLLTQAIGQTSSVPLGKAERISPVSWYDVLALFDPAQTNDVEERCGGGTFLDLHHEVWLRAGVPGFLGPPPGSFLDRLFHRHSAGFHFAQAMDYRDVRRWITHMYESKRFREREPCAESGDGRT